jgi:DNA repair protein RadC
MSQRSLPAINTSLLVRGARGHYRPATPAAAHQVIDQKMRRGASFASPADAKAYLRTKLAGFEHEIFAILFLDTRHRLIE